MNILIITLLVLDIGIILLLILLMRRFSRKDEYSNASDTFDDLLQPLLTEAKSVSYKLEVLLKDKEKFVNDLTDKLDLRISKAIQLSNHPLSSYSSSSAPLEKKGQTESFNHFTKPNQPKPEKSKNFKEFQDDVVKLSHQGFSSDEIAVKLSVAKEDVDLILSLKRNIEQVRDITADMEKNDSFKKMNFSEVKQKSPFVKDILARKEKKSIKSSSGLSKNTTLSFSKESNADSLNTDEILKLSRRGVQSNAIAQKMGVSKGEVDLVLGLKKKFQKIERNYNNLNAYR
jgi:hypothetical protein